MASSTRVATRPRSSPDDVRRERHHPLPVEAIVLADDRAVLDARDVAEQRMRRAVGRDRHAAQIVERRHARLWHFDLHLERDAGPRIGPVVRRDEPARRRGRRKRSADLIDRHAELAGELAIDVDVDGRIVERLPELQIAQSAESSRARRAPSSRTPRLAAKSGPVIATSTGVGAPKFMMRLTMSPGSNENCAAGKSLREALAQPFLRAARCGSRRRLERHLQHALVRARRSTGRWC